MTYRFGRTSRGRYAATLAGVTAYNPVSLKATEHLTEPASVAPATTPQVDFSTCGEDDGRKYGRHRRVKKGRRRRRKSTLRRARVGKTARGKCDDLFDKTKPLGGDEYIDCILELIT